MNWRIINELKFKLHDSKCKRDKPITTRMHPNVYNAKQTTKYGEPKWKIDILYIKYRM